MSVNYVKARQKQRIATSAEWQDVNPVLLAGELGIESDTLYMKVGNGSTAWNDLKYLAVNTSADIDLSNYYTKDETDSAISTAIDGIDTDVDLSNYVTLTGAEIIKGAKTFTGSTTFSGNTYVSKTPTSDIHAANKQYVDNAISSATPDLSDYITDTSLTARLSDYATESYVGELIASLLSRIEALENGGNSIQATLADGTSLTSLTTAGLYYYTDANYSVINGADEKPATVLVVDMGDGKVLQTGTFPFFSTATGSSHAIPFWHYYDGESWEYIVGYPYATYDDVPANALSAGKTPYVLHKVE